MLWMFLKSFCAGTMPIFNGNEALNAMLMPGFPIMQETKKLNDDIGTNREFRSLRNKHGKQFCYFNRFLIQKGLFALNMKTLNDLKKLFSILSFLYISEYTLTAVSPVHRINWISSHIILFFLFSVAGGKRMIIHHT